MPNPGSTEAQERGCECPVYDNHMGKGIEMDGVRVFWMNGDCSLHGSLIGKNRKPNRTPTAESK